MSFSYLTLIYLHRMNLADTLCNDIALTHNITTFIHNLHIILQAWNGTVLPARFPTPPVNRRYSADRFNSWIFPNVRRKEVMHTAGPTTTFLVVCNVSGKYNAHYWSGLVRLARRVGNYFLHHHVQNDTDSIQWISTVYEYVPSTKWRKYPNNDFWKKCTIFVNSGRQ
jgi:hypothetical protein